MKFLDACTRCSPSRSTPTTRKGQKLANDNGKTEAWVIVHADPGSLIYAGLNQGVTRDDLAAAMAEGRVEPLLHRFEPEPGDCVMIPAGTVHAIGRGIVLAEVQQMSDATFRIDDWGRLGADGRPRAIHARESLESTDFAAGPVLPMRPVATRIAGGSREELARCPYFAIDRLRLSEPAEIGRDDGFTILTTLEGHATLNGGSTETLLSPGLTHLLPASLGACTVRPSSPVTLLACRTP